MKRVIAFIAMVLFAPSYSMAGPGWDWVRTHPMFISSAIAGMHSSPVEWKQTYLSSNVSAVHLLGGYAQNIVPPWAALDPDVPWLVWRWPGNPIVDMSAYAGRIGYQIGDEPEYLSDLDELETDCNAVQAVDPGALCVVNLVSHASQLIFNNAAQWADVITVTNYNLGQGSWQPRKRVRQAALAYDIPFGAYVSAQGQPSDLWWSAFADMTVGAVWLSWWLYQHPNDPGNIALPYVTMFEDPGDYYSPQTWAWYEIASVNAALAAYGQAMTQLTSVDVRYTSSDVFPQYGGFSKWTAPGWFTGQQIPHVTAISRPSGGDYVFGMFKDAAGNDYIAIFNARHASGDSAGTLGTAAESVVLTFDLPPNSIVRQLNENGVINDRQINQNSLLYVNIPAGHMRLLTFPGHAFVGYE